jgi:hypothetical protein
VFRPNGWGSSGGCGGSTPEADQLQFTALIVVGVLGVPVVHHRWGVDPASDLALRDARTGLADLAAAAGLDEVPSPVTKLGPCPPTLRRPTAEPGTPIRFVPFNGNLTVALNGSLLGAPYGGVRAER